MCKVFTNSSVRHPQDYNPQPDPHPPLSAYSALCFRRKTLIPTKFPKAYFPSNDWVVQQVETVGRGFKYLHNAFYCSFPTWWSLTYGYPSSPGEYRESDGREVTRNLSRVRAEAERESRSLRSKSWRKKRVWIERVACPCILWFLTLCSVGTWM